MKIAIIEVGKNYAEFIRFLPMTADTLEEAIQAAEDAGYWVLPHYDRGFSCQSEDVDGNPIFGVSVSPKQAIHHINGDPTDNRIENLCYVPIRGRA